MEEEIFGDSAFEENENSSKAVQQLQPVLPVQPILTGLIQAQAGLNEAVNFLAHMQAAHMKSNFEAMSLEQRDVYCQNMKSAGFGNSLEQITGKSYSTINRHLNGKNS